MQQSTATPYLAPKNSDTLFSLFLLLDAASNILVGTMSTKNLIGPSSFTFSAACIFLFVYKSVNSFYLLKVKQL